MRKHQGAELPLTPTHWLQLTAAIMLIIAGWLWSSKLAITTYEAQVASINDSLDDQVALLRKRIAAQNDALELITTGRGFLDAQSPRFAVITLERAVNIEPTLRDGWYLLAYSYVELANQHYEPFVSRNKAVAALKKALEVDPGYTPAKELLAQLQR